MEELQKLVKLENYIDEQFVYMKNNIHNKNINITLEDVELILKCIRWNKLKIKRNEEEDLFKTKK